MNFIGKITFVLSNFFIVRFARTKTVPFISFVFFSVFFQNNKKLKGQFLWRAKRTTKKFDPVKVDLPQKFRSLGCPMVILRSETLLYMSTPLYSMILFYEHEWKEIHYFIQIKSFFFYITDFLIKHHHWMFLILFFKNVLLNIISQNFFWIMMDKN